MVQGMHITQGVSAVLAMGPGMFITSMLYGSPARRMGTILRVPLHLLMINVALLQKFTGHSRYCGKRRFLPTIEGGQNIFCNRARFPLSAISRQSPSAKLMRNLQMLLDNIGMSASMASKNSGRKR
jgi:hypothetical protein